MFQTCNILQNITCFSYAPNIYLQDKKSFQESHQLMMLLALLSRFWGYLSKNTVPLADSSCVQHRLANERPDLNLPLINVRISLYFLFNH
jgi:hypothetical protein